MAGAEQGAVLREDGPVLRALHRQGAPRLLLRLDPAGTPSTPTPTMKFTFASALTAVACLSSLVTAAPTVETRRPKAAVYSKCTKAKTVALTFDDGPYVYMYDISKALVAAGAVGTFFVRSLPESGEWTCSSDS